MTIKHDLQAAIAVFAGLAAIMLGACAPEEGAQEPNWSIRTTSPIGAHCEAHSETLLESALGNDLGCATVHDAQGYGVTVECPDGSFLDAAFHSDNTMIAVGMDAEGCPFSAEGEMVQ